MRASLDGRQLVAGASLTADNDGAIWPGQHKSATLASHNNVRRRPSRSTGEQGADELTLIPATPLSGPFSRYTRTGGQLSLGGNLD